MRQHKYRGKRKDIGEWVYGDLVHLYYPIIRVCIAQEGTDQNWANTQFHEVDPATVGEFTGLRDSKRTEEIPEGQEIYEGDRVRITAAIDMFNDDGSISMRAGEEYETCVVNFLDGAFWLGYETTLLDKHLLRMISEDGNWRGEVISTCHDAPEAQKHGT